VNSNAAVILTNDGVVVDSHSKPSAAQALYTEIRGVTKNPVRKIINTHFHWDHWQSNQVYAAESPSLEIITSERTKENMTRPDAGVGGVPFIEKQHASAGCERQPCYYSAATVRPSSKKGRKPCTRRCPRAGSP